MRRFSGGPAIRDDATTSRAVLLVVVGVSLIGNGSASF